MPKSTIEKVSVKRGGLTRNPFLNFLSEFRRNAKGKQMDISIQGGRVWNKMTEAERQPYKNMAKAAPSRRRKRRRKRSVSSSSNSSTLSRRNGSRRRKQLKRKLSQKRKISKKRRKHKEPPKGTPDNEKSDDLSQKQNQDEPPPVELVDVGPETENNADKKCN